MDLILYHLVRKGSAKMKFLVEWLARGTSLINAQNKAEAREKISEQCDCGELFEVENIFFEIESINAIKTREEVRK